MEQKGFQFSFHLLLLGFDTAWGEKDWEEMEQQCYVVLIGICVVFVLCSAVHYIVADPFQHFECRGF